MNSSKMKPENSIDYFVRTCLLRSPRPSKRESASAAASNAIKPCKVVNVLDYSLILGQTLYLNTYFSPKRTQHTVVNAVALTEIGESAPRLMSRKKEKESIEATVNIMGLGGFLDEMLTGGRDDQTLSSI
jgi:hypothetical protein